MAHLCDDYAANLKTEKLLNAAIQGADIREGFEEYLAILDGFYADDITATREGCEGTVIGKDSLRSCVAAFVVPLHAFAEVGGVIVSLRAESVRSEASDETHSRWTLEMTGVTGSQCVLRWRSCRRWRDGRVVHERHCEVERTGNPLTAKDLDMLPRTRAGTALIH